MRDSGRDLLAWYDRYRRDLPWRRTRDPWAIWVSEVMLQQTRVETAIPYFERFLARFPDPGALARADEAEVLALWSGLGYYRRARQLRAAAREVAGSNGTIPRRAAELERLPGIGAYTAAAVASIAFGEPVAVVDGNVERVLARRLALAGPLRAASGARAIREAAEALLDPARPGDSNQALMELGATVCTPRAPRCGDCPLSADCAAFAAGEPERWPLPRPRPATVRVAQRAAWVEDPAGRLLFARRAADDAVLPSLWELPTVEATSRAAAERALGAGFGGRWRLGDELARARHAITHRAISIVVHAARWTPEGTGERSELEWKTAEEARERALTGATRKLLARLTSRA